MNQLKDISQIFIDQDVYRKATEFDEIVNNFIDGNLTLALVLINIIINYISFN